MKAALRIVAALALLGCAAGAGACGYCIEDRMAAVYDHRVMTRAAAAGHKIAFFAVQGPPSADGATADGLRHDLARVRGVDRDSVRYSAELASLSLSFDPRATPFAALDRALARVLAPRGLTLGLIDIVDRPSQIRAGRTAAR